MPQQRDRPYAYERVNQEPDSPYVIEKTTKRTLNPNMGVSEAEHEARSDPNSLDLHREYDNTWNTTGDSKEIDDIQMDDGKDKGKERDKPSAFVGILIVIFTICVLIALLVFLVPAGHKAQASKQASLEANIRTLELLEALLEEVRGLRLAVEERGKEGL